MADYFVSSVDKCIPGRSRRVYLDSNQVPSYAGNDTDLIYNTVRVFVCQHHGLLLFCLTHASYDL